MGNTHYSPNQGFIELREAIAHYMKRRFHLVYDPKSQIVVTVGGSEAIDIAVRAVINPGDEVIIPEPCFVAYKNCVLMAGGVPVTIPLRAEDQFVLQPEQLRQALTPRTKMLMLGYPNNPTGAVMNRGQLQAIVDVIADQNILVLSDELYAELTYEPAQHCSIAELDGMAERTIVIGGFSKAFAMTRWRIGFACGPDPILMTMNKIHQYVIMSSPTTAQDAAVEALHHAGEHIAPMREEYNRRRRFVVHACQEMGLPCFEPLGAFYVFPDIRRTGLPSNEFCERFLREEKVAIVPGNAFGECGEGFVRISYAASLESIRKPWSVCNDLSKGTAEND
jgi:aminotransferase